VIWDTGASRTSSAFGGVDSREVSEGVLPPKMRRRSEDIPRASAGGGKQYEYAQRRGEKG
jgi:hypothetical protein